MNALQRTYTALLACMAIGCGGNTGALQQMQRANQELQREIESAKQALQQARAVQNLGLATHAPRRYDAFVNYQPTFCSGAMCLEITNHRSYPIGDLTIDGTPIPLHRSAASVQPTSAHAQRTARALRSVRIAGPYLAPGESAFVALQLPKRYIITANVLLAYEGPNGAYLRPPGVVLERCEVRMTVPTAAHLQLGAAKAIFEGVHCDPVTHG